jgi:diguanylate cyclase (GGDEF)-like protein
MLQLQKLWSATDFPLEAVNAYARPLLISDTRRGIIAMAALMLFLQVCTLGLQLQAGTAGNYIYTFVVLALLAVHVMFSARSVDEVRTLHVLGIALLVMSGTAIVLLAHRLGQFDLGLMTAAAMLIMAIPLVPWGLKEAVAASLLIYALFTLSTLLSRHNFDAQALSTLQFLFIAASCTAWVLVGRNVHVRKDDYVARHALEEAQSHNEMLSMTDPLTGAWNRRFLDRSFDRLLNEARYSNHPLQISVLDIDAFKTINDTLGHHAGDAILKELADVLTKNLSADASVIRLGGDEFAILSTDPEFRELVERCLDHLSTSPALLAITDGQPVTVSAGFAETGADESNTLEDLYRRADAHLYQFKRQRSFEQSGRFARHAVRGGRR